MSFTGNGITNCYPDQVDNFVSITVLRRYWYELLKRVWRVLKTKKLRSWDWPDRLPILVIGGGSKLPFFDTLVKELELRERLGAMVIPLPVQGTMPVELAQPHRIAVAWGLSYRAVDMGDITPADRVGDVEGPDDDKWMGRYIGKEDV